MIKNLFGQTLTKIRPFLRYFTKKIIEALNRGVSIRPSSDYCDSRPTGFTELHTLEEILELEVGGWHRVPKKDPLGTVFKIFLSRAPRGGMHRKF
ncbi:hypothetical protein [Komagataeibacter europaeus]|uniref:hypothetical protein n=1 Tax=Komagataeibacter europaeus TaxID=33995 RepID=UPI0015FD04CD|nr:hypothetical protein [Komagataeibacter europaeus]